jgi:Histidine kinase-, DNA gyrase B-, and HSP90-like ATPase
VKHKIKKLDRMATDTRDSAKVALSTPGGGTLQTTGDSSIARKSETDTYYPVRARSHLLQLLGEELIGDDRLAVFELVKNGYDADATTVTVEINVNSGPSHSIVVEDSGSGMTLNDITGKWLELATDSKRKDRLSRTKRFNRLALGEKGVGRIAAFKLGRQVNLITRAQGHLEYETSIDWTKLLDQGPYLEDLSVQVWPNAEPKVFDGKRTGTKIAISDLRRPNWTRGDLRKLYRLVTSLASPFHTPDQFRVKFSAPGREEDIADLISPNDFIALAIWKFHFRISGKCFDWEYSFDPPHWRGLKARSIRNQNDHLLLTPQVDEEGRKRRSRTEDEALLLGKEDLKDIGSIEGHIYGYYRRSEVLNAIGSASQMKAWLDDQTGVRVYRDGVRVFNYGEKNDDWLGLNVRRINAPTAKLGTNSVVAAIDLNLSESPGLREKTNREGFDQNDAFYRLQRIVLSVFEHLERTHADDRKSLDEVIKGTKGEKPVRFSEAIKNLKLGLKEHNLDNDFGRYVEEIEREFTQLRDVMVNAGTAGLNLAVIFHEIEREVDALATAVDRGVGQNEVRSQIEHLYELLHGFAPLLKKNPARVLFASEIISAAKRLRESRFKFHKALLSVPLLEDEEPDFRVRGPANLLTGCIGNLLDNALFWARYRRERDERSDPASVLVRTDWDKKSKSGLIAIVDNGPGFTIPAARATEPFVTARSGGMGLGLYFAQLVMEMCEGELTIHTASEFRDEIKFPRSFDGAAVVMRFGGVK